MHTKTVVLLRCINFYKISRWEERNEKRKTHEENNTYAAIWFIDGGWSTNGD